MLIVRIVVPWTKSILFLRFKPRGRRIEGLDPLEILERYRFNFWLLSEEEWVVALRLLRRVKPGFSGFEGERAMIVLVFVQRNRFINVLSHFLFLDYRVGLIRFRFKGLLLKSG